MHCRGGAHRGPRGRGALWGRGRGGGAPSGGAAILAAIHHGYKRRRWLGVVNLRRHPTVITAPSIPTIFGYFLCKSSHGLIQLPIDFRNIRTVENLNDIKLPCMTFHANNGAMQMPCFCPQSKHLHRQSFLPGAEPGAGNVVRHCTSRQAPSVYLKDLWDTLYLYAQEP